MVLSIWLNSNANTEYCIKQEVLMNVFVYSREAIGHIIAEGSFPDNTAVISFCDPELKHIDKDYSRVD